MPDSRRAASIKKRALPSQDFEAKTAKPGLRSQD
jgi:hypothetical protein